MPNELSDLTQLLRCELTAVHQQFFHVLALQQWNTTNLASRIAAVDTEDFQNAMQIIDLLVSRGERIALSSHQVLPGVDESSILRSELRMEEQLADILDALQLSDPEAVARIERAQAPRAEYRGWLAERLATAEPARSPSEETGAAMAAFLAHLITLIELTMLHAFLLWHTGNRTEADNTWRLSGAAMLYEAALVKQFAVAGTIPTPALISGIKMAANSEEAFAAEMTLVSQCADLGRAAASEQTDDTMRRLCIRIADDCDLIACMELGGVFPAELGYSPVFNSFAATREKHLA